MNDPAGVRFEHGSVSAFVVALLGLFVVCGGLALDGGRIAATYVQLADHAENAARAGAQQLESLRSGDPVLDPAAAAAVAREYLAAVGAGGEVSVRPREIVVTARADVSMTLLALFAVAPRPVSATRAVAPVVGP